MTFTVNDQKYTVSGLDATATKTDVNGETTFKVSGKAVVKDASDNDVTSQFEVKTKPGTLTISPRSVTLTSASDEKVYDGTALTNGEVAVTGDGFVEGEGATYNVTGSQTVAGSSDNTFSYQLKDNTKAENYTIETKNGTLTVTDRAEKYVIELEGNDGNKQYDGDALTVNGFKTMTFTVNDQKYTVSGLDATATKTDVNGETTFKVSGKAVVKDASDNDVTSQFEVKTKPGTLTISPRPVKLTSASDSKEYDGTALTNGTVTADGFVKDEGAEYNVTGSQTVVGSSANTFTYTLKNGTKAENYTIETKNGTLTVKDREKKYVIELEGNDGNKQYDGDALTVNGFKTMTFTVNDQKYTVSGLDATATKTDVNGETTFKVSGKAVVKDASDNDVTSQFEVKTKPGTLTISPRSVTLTSASDEKVYDGQPLTKDEVKVSGDGFVEGEGATYNVTGTVTEVKDSPATNTFTYKLNKGTEAKNYNIELAPGKLTVTPVETEVVVTITGRTDEMPYDGKEHSVSGYDVTVSNELYKPKEDMQFNGTDVDMTAKGTDAGTYAMELTAEDFTNKSKNFSKVTFVVTDGYVKITPRPVTLTSETASKTYDGTPLTRPNVTVSTGENEGFVEGEVSDIKATGSVTNAGSVANTITFTPNKETFKEGNYAITKTEGTLTIAKRSVLISSQSATKTYDGSALTRPAVTITGDGFVPGELAKAEATGSITNVGSTPNTIRYTTTGAFNAANYSIALSVGTLTVTEKPQPEPRRTFNLTINYVYQNGKRAAASYNRGGLKNGETFDITSPVIAGYTASETVVSGTIYNRDIKVTVIYTADGVNLDDYGVPLGLGNITMNVGDCFE